MNENNMVILETKPISELTTEVVIKVAHVGVAGNGVEITEEALKGIAETLPGAPIIGYYNGEDFEGHNKYPFIKDGEIKFDTNTRPYGFVDPFNKPWLENREDSQWLICRGYMWSRQWQEAGDVKDKGQSMEVTVNGEFDTETNIFIATEATLNALCILGENHPPAFTGSEFLLKTQYSGANSYFESYDNDFKAFFEDLKQILSDAQENKENKKEIDMSQDVKLESPAETVEVVNTEAIPEEKDTRFSKDFALDISRLNWTVSDILAARGFIGLENERLYELTGVFYSLGEFYALLTRKTDYALYRMRITLAEDTLTVEESTLQAVSLQIVQQEPSAEQVSNSVQTVVESPEASYFEEENKALKAEIETLKAFKAEMEAKEKNEYVENFELLTAEEKAPVKEKIADFSIDEVKAQLALLFTEKQLAAQTKEIKPVITVAQDFSANSTGLTGFLATAIKYETENK